jgi:hypothetical protein
MLVSIESALNNLVGAGALCRFCTKCIIIVVK